MFRIGIYALVLAALLGTFAMLKVRISELEMDVQSAEVAEEAARRAALTERMNATALQRRLELSQRRAERALEAQRVAEQARDDALSASRERDDNFTRIATVERERDATLNQCLAYELPDSLLRELPE